MNLAAAPQSAVASLPLDEEKNNNNIVYRVTLRFCVISYIIFVVGIHFYKTNSAPAPLTVVTPVAVSLPKLAFSTKKVKDE